MILKDIKNIFHIELDTLYGKEEVAHFFYMLIEHYLGLERFVLAIDPNITVSKDEEKILFEGLSQLKLERPIQYIIGMAQFMDLQLKVDENVLIPRPETEELVRWILKDLAKVKKPIKILDIGTGSGCIAIALAKNLPNAVVAASDISGKALKVAEFNARLHEVDILFMEADMRSMQVKKGDYSIIVSNPPYVLESEKTAIRNHVKNREPAGALFVPDETPLLCYEYILKVAKIGLKPGGTLYLEINQDLGKDTILLLEDQKFSEIELRKDMFGKDRMVKAKWNTE